MYKIRDTRKKQIFVVDDEYLNGYAKLCGIYATGIYLSLCRHASSEQKCFPSKKLLGEELDIGERTVYNGLLKLQEWNIIKIDDQERKQDGSYKNNTYILLDKSEWKAKPSARDAYGTVGTPRHYPQAPHDISRRHVVPNKGTHNRRVPIIEGSTKKEMQNVAKATTPYQDTISLFRSKETQEKVIAWLCGRGMEKDTASKELAKFIMYWTERNSSGTKERWQTEKVFDVKRRLANWFSRISDFSKKEDKPDVLDFTKK